MRDHKRSANSACRFSCSKPEIAPLIRLLRRASRFALGQRGGARCRKSRSIRRRSQERRITRATVWRSARSMSGRSFDDRRRSLASLDRSPARCALVHCRRSARRSALACARSSAGSRRARSASAICAAVGARLYGASVGDCARSRPRCRNGARRCACLRPTRRSGGDAAPSCRALKK